MRTKELKTKNKGITLIALVVTIVVLLILAGVSISMLSGDDGIIKNAQEAKNKTEQGEKDEKTNLAQNEDLINEYIDGIEVEKVRDSNPGGLEGTGTDDDPYTINSIEDLVFFAYDVTNGNTYEGKTVKLGTSLDFKSTKSYVDPLRTDYGKYGYDGELKTLLTTGEGFKPIGTTYDADISTNYFKGLFDGNYNIVYNLFQNYEDSENTSIIGFFSTNAGTVNNLRIENSNISAITNNMHIVAGVICGRNNGNITNCGGSGNLKITDNGVKSTYVAGIVGQAFGGVEKSFSKTNIEITSNNISNINVGGIAGAVTAEYIKSCYNTGTINININANSSNTLIVGGISGYNTKKVENSYNTGNINVQSSILTTKTIEVGNITGFNNQGETNNCFNSGQLNIDLLSDNDTTFVGNIMGNIYRGTINNCYNIGKINFNNVSVYKSGQIVGRTHSALLNDCFGIIEENIVSIGSEHNSTINNVTLINKDKIPNIIQVVGEDFTIDSNNINQDYPILNWE